MGSVAISARSAQAWRQRGSCAATAATAARRWSGGRDRAASRAAASSGARGSRTVSGLPEVNWTECSGVTSPCYERMPENGRGAPPAGERNVGAERPRCTLRAVATPDDPSNSFGHHPGLRDREPEARELADALRRLIRLSVSTAPPASATARLAAQLAAVADELETFR